MKTLQIGTIQDMEGFEVEGKVMARINWLGKYTKSNYIIDDIWVDIPIYEEDTIINTALENDYERLDSAQIDRKIDELKEEG